MLKTLLRCLFAIGLATWIAYGYNRLCVEVIARYELTLQTENAIMLNKLLKSLPQQEDSKTQPQQSGENGWYI